MTDNEVPFSLDEVGAISNESFKGEFKVKKALSFRESLQKDQIRRDLLGDTNGSPASYEAQEYATMLSELRVRLVDPPAWWKEANNGAELRDENVLLKVWSETVTIVNAFLESKKAAVEAARKKLESEVKSNA